MVDFQGVIPAIITPMTEEGDLNEPALRKLMEFNIQSGVHGFWTAGGSGESILLSEEENHRIAQITADQNRGRVKNIMHVGAATTAQSTRMAERAAQAGVEAICSVPPFFYRTSDQMIVEHYRAIGAAANLPLFVYNLPHLTGVEITLELMTKIQEAVPQLAGLKHSAPDFNLIPAFRKMGLECLSGYGRMMLPALTLGASGCVDGPLCIAPERWVEIWNAYHDGDLARAQAAQDKAIELFSVLLSNGYFPALKAFTSERLGIDCGSPRPPMQQVTARLKAIIGDEAIKLGLSPADAIMRNVDQR